MANKTISLDPQKSKRARSTLYATPKAMADDSGTRNYKISERTIRSIEEGKKVKLSTAENYSTILGYGVNELAKIRTSEEVTNLEIDVSGTQIFGSCSENLLKDWSRFSYRKLNCICQSIFSIFIIIPCNCNLLNKIQVPRR